MSDRKYRQRGYQDSDEDRGKPRGPAREPREPGRPRGDKTSMAPRTPNMPGFQQTVRCTRCGQEVRTVIVADSQCPKCSTALHSCAQCASFDPGSRFECMQPVPARISPKDARNDCRYFEPRVKVERQTGSSREGPPSAKSAFDALFKDL